ncbi:MAG: bacteriohemerythrin [Pseudomonadales bacterium]|uniref:bacteriohemerythrin n=1 Tax=Marinobacter xestospongiae TaxID=994319 RepID=UPI002004D7B2|nr:bacteriohemerythrin [Marinobacter xestospongiae]MCG8519497.1 bacteriohemerythrin [Pseudomonadales bacterium]MCK7566888.1 bacteriohemerythrin [Marinobacter xestospongiae]
MTFWPWSEELEVGISDIDQQHRWLVDQTNRLHEALENQAEDSEIGDLLEGLMDYTMNHFIVEEDLFARLGYPETEAHKREHDTFTQKVMTLIDRHEQGDASGAEALALLKDWLTHHILKVDKAYVEHFRTHGIG